MRECDVLIIGSGAAGQTVAAECAKAGKSVVVVDRLPFGGTCALRGCLPKKVLLAGAEAVTRADALLGAGVDGSCRVDWTALMQRKDTYVDDVPHKTESWMRELGIATLSGTARFTSPDEVAVGDESIRPSSIVIATGARPIDLGIEGSAEVMTSTDFLSMRTMPAEVAFIGGGYISFEFARLAQLAGARVTILHRSSQVLVGFDPMLANQLLRRYRSLGISVMTEAQAVSLKRLTTGRLSVETTGGTIEVDEAFHGAGRVPDIDSLALDTGRVDHGTRGVTVDAQLRSVSNPRVWSAGDAAAVGAPLTPVAGAQGQVVAAGILGKPVTFDGSATPSVVFSDPPIASLGISVADAEVDEALEIRSFDMSDWFTQTRVGNTTAGAHLITERGSGLIRGAHLLGVEVDEIINVFALAMRFGISIAELRTVTWSYPTLAYEINYLSGRY